MNSWLVFGCAFTLFSTQDLSKNESFFEAQNQIVMYVDINGQLKSKPLYMMSVSFFPEQEYLRCDSVRDELELVDRQKKELNALFNRIDAERLHYGREVVNTPNRDQQAFFRKFGAEIAAELDELLLPHQVERLSEIKESLELRQKGISLYVAKVAQKNKLNFDKEILQQEIENEKRRVQQVGKEFAEETFEGFLSKLSKAQRVKLTKIVGDANIEKSNLELVWLDVTNLKHNDGQLGSPSSSILEKLGSRRIFSMNLDGSIQRNSTRHVSDESPLLGLANAILKDSSKFPDLELSDQQLVNVEDMVNVLRATEVDIKYRYADQMEAANSTKEQEDFRSEYHSEKRRIRKEFHDDFLKTVPEAQLEKLNQRVLRIGIISNGLMSELVTNEWVQHQLDLTDRQIEELRVQVSNSTGPIEEKLLDLEEQSLRTILSTQPDELRKLIERSLGKRPKQLPPLVSVMLR